MLIYNHRLFISLTLLIFCTPTLPMENPTKKLKSKHAASNLGEQLVRAAKNGDLEKVKSLLAAGAPVDHENRNKFTALMKSQHKNHKEVVRVLIDAGADINKRHEYLGCRVLDCAVAHNRVEIVSMLIAAGADLYEEDFTCHRGKRTVLERAAYFGDQRICEMIVEKLASLRSEAQKKKLYTVMHCFKIMHPVQYPNLRNVFKPHLRAMIIEENFADPDSVVRKEICKINYEPEYEDRLYDKSKEMAHHLIDTYCKKQ